MTNNIRVTLREVIWYIFLSLLKVEKISSTRSTNAVLDGRKTNFLLGSQLFFQFRGASRMDRHILLALLVSCWRVNFTPFCDNNWRKKIYWPINKICILDKNSTTRMTQKSTKLINDQSKSLRTLKVTKRLKFHSLHSVFRPSSFHICFSLSPHDLNCFSHREFDIA